jgi:hypothetical protein
MNNKVNFVQLDAEQLELQIAEGVKRGLDKFFKNFNPHIPKAYLSRKEVSELLGIHLTSVDNWCRSGKLNKLAISGRILFLRSEVEASLISLKV